MCRSRRKDNRGPAESIPAASPASEFWRVLVLPQFSEKRNFRKNASQYWNVQSLLTPKQILDHHVSRIRRILMAVHVHQNSTNNRSVVLAFVVLVGAMVVASPASAQTYVSAEPIPSAQIVGKENLA